VDRGQIRQLSAGRMSAPSKTARDAAAMSAPDACGMAETARPSAQAVAQESAKKSPSDWGKSEMVNSRLLRNSVSASFLPPPTKVYVKHAPFTSLVGILPGTIAICHMYVLPPSPAPSFFGYSCRTHTRRPVTSSPPTSHDPPHAAKRSYQSQVNSKGSPRLSRRRTTFVASQTYSATRAHRPIIKL
jgi:hypothetical protein